mmetsp:Transcript_42560/g.97587  ORF Transcript_42560/g.97587 Transcript_42560/m.97587 type:complete len:264 (-) Transcript_42560:18-809(-)
MDLVLSVFEQHQASKGVLKRDHIEALVVSLLSASEPVTHEDLDCLKLALQELESKSSSGVLEAETFVKWIFLEEQGGKRENLGEEASAIRIQSAQRALAAKREVAERRHLKALAADEEEIAHEVIGNYAVRAQHVIAPSRRKSETEAYAAVKIQSAHRGLIARREVSERFHARPLDADAEADVSEMLVQLSRQVSKNPDSKEIDTDREEAAAVRIQCAHRALNARREHALRAHLKVTDSPDVAELLETCATRRLERVKSNPYA